MVYYFMRVAAFLLLHRTYSVKSRRQIYLTLDKHSSHTSFLVVCVKCSLPSSTTAGWHFNEEQPHNGNTDKALTGTSS